MQSRFQNLVGDEVTRLKLISSRRTHFRPHGSRRWRLEIHVNRQHGALPHARMVTGLWPSVAPTAHHHSSLGQRPTAVEIRKGTWLAAGQSQLRRSGIFVETSGSTRASSPVGAACSALCRSYGALEFSEPSFYKDATPTGLNSCQVTLIQRQWGNALGNRSQNTSRAEGPVHSIPRREIRVSLRRLLQFRKARLKIWSRTQLALLDASEHRRMRNDSWNWNSRGRGRSASSLLREAWCP